jgi:hypothetical protein
MRPHMIDLDSVIQYGVAIVSEAFVACRLTMSPNKRTRTAPHFASLFNRVTSPPNAPIGEDVIMSDMVL